MAGGSVHACFSWGADDPQMTPSSYYHRLTESVPRNVGRKTVFLSFEFDQQALQTNDGVARRRRRLDRHHRPGGCVE
jgi:hypothetical protein